MQRLDGLDCIVRFGPLSSLTPTSYVVLGLLSYARTATPYELKQGLAGSVGNFWSVPHSQLYAEPDRLVRLGLLHVDQEPMGRRRKRYGLTDAGRAALDAWVREPAPTEPAEIRDEALLRLFFGADPEAVARGQLPAHRAKLAAYEATMAGRTPGSAPGPFLALEAGIAHEREWIRFWSRLAGDD